MREGGVCSRDNSDLCWEVAVTMMEMDHLELQFGGGTVKTGRQIKCGELHKENYKK